MKVMKFIKDFKANTFVSLARGLIFQKLLILKSFRKRRKIRNNFQTNSLVVKYLPNSLNFEKIRNIFFNKDLFAYTKLIEKEQIMKLLTSNCTEEIKSYIEFAEKIIRNEFTIFEKDYDFKNKINWHYSFFHNYNWKLEKSENIDIRPKGKNIDVKYVWEFNRHNFFPYLGVAYFITKNEKYAKKFKLLILDWIEKNPPLYGINWYSGLEISVRLISWIFSLFFFKESKEINNDIFFKIIFCSMFHHAYFLRYFYTRHSFNHTIGDMFGVYLFSKIFEEIKPIKKWEKFFFKNFVNQIHLQTRLDGTNIEQSVNYHRFVLEFFTLFSIINPEKLKKETLSLIENMYVYLLHIIKPNQTYPLIGDSDDGKVLLLTSLKRNSTVDLINLGSILFARGDFKFISKNLSPISILLLGLKGVDQYEKLQIVEPKSRFEFFKNAGYIVFRNNWTNKANYLFVDYGRFGPRNAPHSHSSVTSFIYSYNGKDIIIDSGTYTYNKSWAERNFYRGSQSHNVLAINKMNQAKIISWFAWEKKPRIKRIIKINDNYIDLGCFHNGYNGFLIKREIITKTTLNNLIIIDSIFPTQELSKEKLCNIEIYFHFHSDIQVKIENNYIFVDQKLNIKISSNQQFNLTIEKSPYSPNYGIKYKSNKVIIQLKHIFRDNNPIEVKTEIEPIK